MEFNQQKKRKNSRLSKIWNRPAGRAKKKKLKNEMQAQTAGHETFPRHITQDIDPATACISTHTQG
jgi:hypothetical protein